MIHPDARSLCPSRLQVLALAWALLLTGLPRMAWAETAHPPATPPSAVHWIDDNDTTAGFDADGNLTVVRVKRFGEDILGTPFYTPDSRKVDSAQEFPSLPPPFVPGLRVGLTSLPLGPQGKSEWTVKADIGQGRATFIASDPKGKMLPAGCVVERRYALAPHHRLSVDLAVTPAPGKPLQATTAQDLSLFLGPVVPPQQHLPEIIEGHADGSVVRASVKAEPTPVTTDARWIGVRSNFYAWIVEPTGSPAKMSAWQPHIVDRTGQALTGAMLAVHPAPPTAKDGKLSMHLTLYLGPKVVESLGESYRHVFNNWDAWYGGIGQWMFWLLQFLHTMTGSYGLSILLLTFGVKLALHPLAITQTRSMLKMQELKPKLDELKNRYKDPNQFQQETMRLYKENDVNPLGGCFPMMLQIPIFIALYGCLSGAIELKGVPFLWLPDLSSPDPTFVLPIAFALTMYLSSRGMQQAQPSQDQATAAMMGKVMPILMLFLMRKVAGGVMLYLSGQTVLSTVEQKLTKAQLEREAARKPPDDTEKTEEPPPPPSPRTGKKGRARSRERLLGA